jgi:hypothetical protein
MFGSITLFDALQIHTPINLGCYPQVFDSVTLSWVNDGNGNRKRRRTSLRKKSSHHHHHKML